MQSKTAAAFLLVFSCSVCLGQKKGNYVEILNNNGSVTVRQTFNEFNTSKEKDYILNVDKYIDTAKPISILLGSNVLSYYNLEDLKKGVPIQPLGGNSAQIRIDMPGMNTGNIMEFKLQKGKLKISSEVMGFDGKRIVRVEDNKLYPTEHGSKLYASDRYFEIYDDYDIPVLQIELIKETNSIYIGGAFNFDTGYVVISKDHGIVKRFVGSILMKSKAGQDSVLAMYKTQAAVITPIHPN